MSLFTGLPLRRCSSTSSAASSGCDVRVIEAFRIDDNDDALSGSSDASRLQYGNFIGKSLFLDLVDQRLFDRPGSRHDGICINTYQYMVSYEVHISFLLSSRMVSTFSGVRLPNISSFSIMAGATPQTPRQLVSSSVNVPSFVVPPISTLSEVFKIIEK